MRWKWTEEIGKRDVLADIALYETNQLKFDEPSLQQRGNPSAMNQLLAQIQDFQDKVNSLNVSREWYVLKEEPVRGYPTFPLSL